MAYIGKQPSTKFSAAAKIDTFTGDGSTVAFDLANIVPAGGENGLQVYVNNVRQKPGASNAYTLGNDGSGDLKRITFTEAPENSAEIYVITTYEATNIKNVGDGTITTAKLDDGAVTSAKILDGTIVNADINASAAIADTKLATISTSGKVATSAISQPGSPGVYLDGTGSWSAIDTSQQDTNAFNIGLLGFKMAVNEGLTVFNLVDGVVDEFNDESGTDEAEGTNDNYCATSDFYQNLSAPIPYSAGFTISSITEPDTSTAGTNPTVGSGTKGTFTVPSGVTSINAFIFGSGGGGSSHGAPCVTAGGGGGGFTSGTLAVTPTQAISVYVGEGGDSDSGSSTLSETGGFFGGGSGPNAVAGQAPGAASAAGGGLSGIFSGPLTLSPSTGAPDVPNFYAIAGSGGGGGGHLSTSFYGGAGGGLTGKVGGATPQAAQSCRAGNHGGGGTQSAGGQSDAPTGGQNGALLIGGTMTGSDRNTGGGGGGYYGGASGTACAPGSNNGRAGGGGSSYYGHPQISCGATTAGDGCEGGGVLNPNYVAGTNEGIAANITPAPTVFGTKGEDGYVLITASGTGSTTSTTIVSTAFSSTSVPTTARIVVFEENIDTPTLNTDIIASVSRDGGTTFTNTTLSDSGYVTGSSGQRILTGQATISGQPSGQSMRWKLALANNAVKIHGVSLQWA